MFSLFRVFRSLLVTGVCAALSGCVSTDLAQTMLTDIDRLKQDNAAMRREMDALGRDMASLKQTLENGNETQGPVEIREPAEAELPEVPAEPDTDMADAPGETEAAPEKPARLNAEEVYSQAQDLYAENRYREAYQAFSQASFLDPDDEFQGRCYYWMGECMFAQGAYQRALDHFGRVFGHYGSTSKAPDALLKIGFTYYEMNNYNGARQALNEFLARFPDHRAVPLAEERLNRMEYKESEKADLDQ
jgi:tol-pal system protein YbgF